MFIDHEERIYKVSGDTISSTYKEEARRKESLWSSDDKVCVVQSRLYTGINAHSGKRWWRWETDRSRGIRRNHRGTLIPFDREKVKGKWEETNTFGHGVLNIMDYPISPLYKHFSEETNSKFNISSLNDIYPMISEFDIALHDVSSGMIGHFREHNAQDFTRSVYGVRNYRRDLVKAVCSAHPSAIALTKPFKGLVPIDWIINFLRNSYNIDAFKLTNLSNFRNTLLSIDGRSYRHLLNDNSVDAMRFINDISRRRYEVDPIYVRSFEELHNNLLVVNPRRNNENEEIKLIELAKKLDGCQRNDLIIYPAKQTKDMFGWGEIMHNCIGSYSRQAVIGNGVYAAVMKDNKLVANLEIVNNDLKQLLGKYNQRLDDDVRMNIIQMLELNGVDCNGNWWGK